MSLTFITLNSLILMLDEVILSTSEVLSLLDMNLYRFHIHLFVFINIFCMCLFRGEYYSGILFYYCFISGAIVTC